MASRLTEIVVDCDDHDGLARFWAEVLGYREVERSDGPDEFWVELAGPPGSGPTVLLLRTPDEKTTKNRLHLDLNPTDRDQAAEVERVLALGAKRIDVGQPADASWVVLADPEGSEFCILASRVEP